MNLLLALAACSVTSAPDASPDRPANVPSEAVSIALNDASILVDGKVVDSREHLETDLVDGIHDPLLSALPTGRTEAWIDADPEAPWMLVRKLVVTADNAGYTSRWVSGGGAGHGPSAKPAARYRPHCDGGPLEATGVSRRLIVDISHGSDGTWVETSVRFHPTVDGSAALGLPDTCWMATCELAGSHKEVCEKAKEGDAAPGRVAVAGPVGCILPIRKKPGQEAAWPTELADNLRRLGITAEDEATLMIEANVPWSAALAVLDGFEQAGLPAPALGLPLVEGHGRPPLCTATVRDASTLDVAEARWLGWHARPSATDDAPAQ